MANELKAGDVVAMCLGGVGTYKAVEALGVESPTTKVVLAAVGAIIAPTIKDALFR